MVAARPRSPAGSGRSRAGVSWAPTAARSRRSDKSTERPAPRRTVYYCAIPAPIGRLFVAASDAGLVRVSFRQSEASFVAELRARLAADVVRSPARTADIVHKLS